MGWPEQGGATGVIATKSVKSGGGSSVLCSPVSASPARLPLIPHPPQPLPQNESIATLLARLEGILGPMPRWMLHRGRYAHKYFLRDGRIFEKNPHTVGRKLGRVHHGRGGGGQRGT